MDPRLIYQLQTPTVALSTLGCLALVAYLMRRVQGADLVAFACLGLASGGVAMALGNEVQRKGERWGWRGLYRSLRRPSKAFIVACASHLPQLLVAAWISFYWRKGKPRENSKRH